MGDLQTTMVSTTGLSYTPGVPYPAFHRQNGLLVDDGGVWSVRAPESIQCSSLLDTDPYIGELCTFKGCIVCRSTQEAEDVKEHILLYANITLDLQRTNRPATFDYSSMLDVFWSNRQTPYNSSEYLKASVTVGEDTKSRWYWRIGHDKWTPSYDKTRIEHRGTSTLQYTYGGESTAYLFVKVEMGLPSSYPVGLIEVMQFQSFSIDRPSLPTTLPPPSHEDPEESSPPDSQPLPTRRERHKPSQVTVTWVPPIHSPRYQEPLPPPTPNNEGLVYLLGFIIVLSSAVAIILIVQELYRRVQRSEHLPTFADRAALLGYGPITANPRDYRTFGEESHRGGASHAGSTACHAPRETPKKYDLEQGLSAWAAEHRRQIPESFEAKLKAAGYLPYDDPDIMTEDEWLSQWSVSRMELQRLRHLYQQREDA